MRSARFACLVLLFALTTWIVSVAQETADAQQPVSQPPANAAQAAAAPAYPPDLQEIVTKQFGPCFKLAMKRSSIEMHYLHPKAGPAWVVFMEGDLDGDGVTDAVIVARCNNPIGGQVMYHYKVTDPYFSYNGYGDPKITAGFASEDPTAGNLVLVIHGEGKEGWRAATPKAKFVMINLPFDTMQMSEVLFHKKPVSAISLTEEGLSAAVFWDGKKYRWQDQGN